MQQFKKEDLEALSIVELMELYKKTFRRVFAMQTTITTDEEAKNTMIKALLTNKPHKQKFNKNIDL